MLSACCCPQLDPNFLDSDSEDEQLAPAGSSVPQSSSRPSAAGAVLDAAAAAVAAQEAAAGPGPSSEAQADTSTVKDVVRPKHTGQKHALDEGKHNSDEDNPDAVRIRRQAGALMQAGAQTKWSAAGAALTMDDAGRAAVHVWQLTTTAWPMTCMHGRLFLTSAPAGMLLCMYARLHVSMLTLLPLLPPFLPAE